MRPLRNPQRARVAARGRMQRYDAAGHAQEWISHTDDVVRNAERTMGPYAPPHASHVLRAPPMRSALRRRISPYDPAIGPHGGHVARRGTGPSCAGRTACSGRRRCPSQPSRGATALSGYLRRRNQHGRQSVATERCIRARFRCWAAQPVDAPIVAAKCNLCGWHCFGITLDPTPHGCHVDACTTDSRGPPVPRHLLPVHSHLYLAPAAVDRRARCKPRVTQILRGAP
jgi:hypothetical protein